MHWVNRSCIAVLCIVLCVFHIQGISQKEDQHIYQKGQSFTYSFSNNGVGINDISKLYASDSITKKRPFANNPSLSKSTFIVQCTITQNIVDITADSIYILYQITKPLVQQNNNLIMQLNEKTRNEIQIPVLAVLTPQGQIKTVYTNGIQSHIALTLIKDVISRLQVIIPANHLQQWSVTEENTTGFYTVLYNYQGVQDGIRQLKKQKTAFTLIVGNKKNENIIPSGFTIIKLNTLNEIESITGIENQVVRFGTDTVSAFQSNLQIHLIQRTVLNDTQITTLSYKELRKQYPINSNLSTPLSEKESMYNSYSHTLGNNHFRDLIQELDADSVHKENMQKIFLKFRALAYLDSTACDSIAAILTTCNFKSYRYKVLTSALTAVETPSSINAICEVMISRQNEQLVLLHLLPVLTTTSAPTSKAIIVAENFAFNNAQPASVQSTAQLALGGLTLHVRKKDSLLYTRTSQYIMEKLNDMPDTTHRLHVLGNSGIRSGMPYIQSCLVTSASVKIRVLAVKALRWIEGEDIMQLLLQLKQDENTDVAKAAIDIIKFKQTFEVTP